MKGRPMKAPIRRLDETNADEELYLIGMNR